MKSQPKGWICKDYLGVDEGADGCLVRSQKH